MYGFLSQHFMRRSVRWRETNVRFDDKNLNASSKETSLNQLSKYSVNGQIIIETFPWAINDCLPRRKKIKQNRKRKQKVKIMRALGETKRRSLLLDPAPHRSSTERDMKLIKPRT